MILGTLKLRGQDAKIIVWGSGEINTHITVEGNTITVNDFNGKNKPAIFIDGKYGKFLLLRDDSSYGVRYRLVYKGVVVGRLFI